MSAPRVLIIGGNAAGMSAASQVKRQQPDWEAVVLEKGRYISYGSCGIPYLVQGLIPQLEDLTSMTPEEASEQRGIDVRLHAKVTAIDPENQEVRVETDRGPQAERFDYLVLATGAVASTGGLDIPSWERVFTLRSLEDGERLHRFLREERPSKAAVIGGGNIAIEMLEAFQAQGLETHLVHRRENLSSTYEKEISDLIKEAMTRAGVVLHLDQPAQKVEPRGQRVVIQTDSAALECDLVLVALGARPNTEFLQESGIGLGMKDSVRVNPRMQTNYPYIYAAGDCAETTQLVTGNPAYVPLGAKANKEGYVAGLNITGAQEEFPGILGTAITKFGDLGVARTGLTLEEAQKNGISAAKYTVKSRNRAGYYPGSERLHSVVVIDEKDGRLLGAQLAGPVDAVKRIDVYAAMINNRMDINQAFQLDLSYAPPFSPVLDPVTLAARVGRKHLRR